MASSSALRAALALGVAVTGLSLWAPDARAQQQAQGFAVERLVQSAPGSGFFVLNDLSWQGGIGGAVSLSLGYAHRPLRLHSSDGLQTLAVIDHQAFASIGMAVSLDRFRLHATFSSPLYVSGKSGVLDGWQYTAPAANLEQNPDTISDVQLGAEVRLFGESSSPVRLGAAALLIVPSGDRADYASDNTFRAVGRLLFAGDAGRFTWAGQVGVHVRPLDESAPGSPRGSELLFGVAGGARLPLLEGSILVGPEIFGATAFRSAFGAETSALEGLLSAAFTDPSLAAGRIRVKLGVGGGMHARFGAPEWRAVLGLELFGQLQAPGNR